MKEIQTPLIGLLVILAFVFFVIDGINRHQTTLKWDSFAWACLVAAGGLTRL